MSRNSLAEHALAEAGQVGNKFFCGDALYAAINGTPKI
jgi:ribosomal protein L10